MNIQKRLWNTIEFGKKAKEYKMFVDDMSKKHIFEMPIYSGFANLTENGIREHTNTRISDYNSFSKVFTGTTGLITAVKNSIQLYSKLVPQLFTQDYTIIREFTADDIISTLTDNVSYLNVDVKTIDEKGNLISDDKTTFFWDLKNKVFKNGMSVQDILDSWNGLSDKGNSFKSEPSKTISVIEYSIAVITREKIGKTLNDRYKKVIADVDDWGYFKGWVQSETKGVSFGGLPGAEAIGNYVSMENSTTIHVSTTREIKEQELFQFYLIPQRSNTGETDYNQFFFISDVKPYFENDVFIFNEITFTSINDSIASTGMTIQQFIQWGAPGEGSYRPKMLYDKYGNETGFEVDQNFVGDLGVHTLQIEQLGFNATNSIQVWGRPIEVKGKESKYIYAPRRLYIREMKLPVPGVLTKNANPENTFYGTMGLPAIDGYYDKWVQRFGSGVSEQMKQRYEGFLETDAKLTKDTNSGKDTHGKEIQKNIMDPTFDFNGAAVFQDKKLNTQLDRFSCKTIIDKTTGETIFLGNKSFDFSTLKNHGPANLLNLMGDFYSYMEVLPLSVAQTTTWFLKDIPFIGGFLSKLLGGIPLGWRDKKYTTDNQYPQLQDSGGAPFLISKGMYNWYVDTLWDIKPSIWENGTIPPDGKQKAGASTYDDQKGLIPLDAFRTDTADEVGTIVGGDTITTTFTFELSDKILAEIWDSKTKKMIGEVPISTIYLGQEVPDKPGCYFLRGKNFEVLPQETETKYKDILGNKNYIVDSVSLKALGQNNIRITSFYENPDDAQGKNIYDFQNYYVMIKSISKFQGSTRYWTTDYKMNAYDEFIIDKDTQFTFPQEVPIPEPVMNVQDMSINMSSASGTIISTNMNWHDTNFDETKDIQIYDFTKMNIHTLEQLQEYFDYVDVYTQYDAHIRVRYHERIFGIWANESNMKIDNGVLENSGHNKGDNYMKNNDTKKPGGNGSMRIYTKDIKDIKNVVINDYHWFIGRHNGYNNGWASGMFNDAEAELWIQDYLIWDYGILKLRSHVKARGRGAWGENTGIGAALWYFDNYFNIYHNLGKYNFHGVKIGEYDNKDNKKQD